MIVLLFPGQGAQRVGMAADLAAGFPVARQALEVIDDALGMPLSRLMFDGPEPELQLTHNAQPAILAHSVAVLAAVGDRLGPVAAAAGHSLGEYSAYVAAGALEPAAAARLVRTRGELMFEAGKARPGAMAAVLGLGTAEVQAACAGASSGNDGVAVAANQNAPDQTVISGDPPAVARASELCKAAGAKRVMPLKVSGAFHSPLMAPAVPGLIEALGRATWGEPVFPVIANASARPVGSASEAVTQLAAQLTAPVRWVECIRAAAAFAPGASFIEMGPGTVLAGLLKRILPDAPCVSLGTAADVERFLA